MEGIDESLYRQWKKALSAMDKDEEAQAPETPKVHSILQYHSRCVGSGRVGLLKQHTDILL